MNQLLNYPAEFLILLFIVITFLQSGLDKLLDWKGQIAWLSGHFSKTPLAKIVPFMLGVILIMEVLSGILAIIGIYQLAWNDNPGMALYAAILSGLTLLFLLFGQRIAKDYQGAFTIVGYLMIVIFGVWLLSGS